MVPLFIRVMIFVFKLLSLPIKQRKSYYINLIVYLMNYLLNDISVFRGLSFNISTQIK